MTEQPATVSGSCLCGAVKFTIPAATDVMACHCKMCRRQTTHYLATVTVTKPEVTFDEQRGLAWYQSSPTARRGFCRDCGSVLFWQDAKYIAVSAGALDDDFHLRLAAHIYVADKGAYYDISDDAPRFAAAPPDDFQPATDRP